MKVAALVCFLALVVANEYSTVETCKKKNCCDASDIANWPCPSWTNEKFTSMCMNNGPNQYSCECAPGFSGKGCDGGKEKVVDSKTEPCKNVGCDGVGTSCENDDDCHDADGGVGEEVCYKGNCAKKCSTDDDCGHTGWSKCKMSNGVGHCDKACVEHEECAKGQRGCDIWVGHCACNSYHKGVTCKDSVHCKDKNGDELDCHHGECGGLDAKTAECICKKHYSKYNNPKSLLHGTCIVDDRCNANEHEKCMSGNALCSAESGKKKCECNQGYGKTVQGDMEICDKQLSDAETDPSPQWKKHILDRHNYVRALVGSVEKSEGKDYRDSVTAMNKRYGQPAPHFNGVDKVNGPAKAMPALVWSEALAANMAKHYKQNGCQMSHSTEKFRSNIKMGSHIHGSGSTFSYAGENLFMSSGNVHTTDSCKGESCGAGEKSAVDSWFSEIEYVNWGQSGSPKSNGKGAIGHYTQVVWAASKFVGCAWCKKGSSTHIGCQYAIGGNMAGQSPYERANGGKTRLIDANLNKKEWEEFLIDDVNQQWDSAYGQRAATTTTTVLVAGVCVAVAVVAIVAAAVVVKRRRQAAAEDSAMEEIMNVETE